MKTTCLQLALVLVVFARWSTDLDVIFTTSCVLCTALTVGEYIKKNHTKKILDNCKPDNLELYSRQLITNKSHFWLHLYRSFYSFTSTRKEKAEQMAKITANNRIHCRQGPAAVAATRSRRRTSTYSTTVRLVFF